MKANGWGPVGKPVVEADPAVVEADPVPSQPVLGTLVVHPASGPNLTASVQKLASSKPVRAQAILDVNG